MTASSTLDRTHSANTQMRSSSRSCRMWCRSRNGSLSMTTSTASQLWRDQHDAFTKSCQKQIPAASRCEVQHCKLAALTGRPSSFHLGLDCCFSEVSRRRRPCRRCSAPSPPWPQYVRTTTHIAGCFWCAAPCATAPAALAAGRAAQAQLSSAHPHSHCRNAADMDADQQAELCGSIAIEGNEAPMYDLARSARFRKRLNVAVSQSQESASPRLSMPRSTEISGCSCSVTPLQPDCSLTL